MQDETFFVVGGGSQTGYNRWGDYSAMVIDPSDDCTLWYTQEYQLTTQVANWNTRIGSFKFSSCGLTPPALSITGPSFLPGGTVGTLYTPTTVTATGGTGSYTWSATGLPPGLSIGPATGTITGTPTTAGTFASATVKVTDSASATASKVYSVTISPLLGITGPASLPTGTVGTAYPSTTVTATGGTGSYTWSATGLPPGLSIGLTTGAITGTPTANAGSPFSVTVKVTDSASATATRPYLLTINAAPLSITGPASLPAGMVGTAYPSTTVTATGGTSPYTWSATGLPPGLSIDPIMGKITGTPTTAGMFNATVKVTDSAPTTVSKVYSVTIRKGRH